MTLGELRRLLADYADDEEVVFVASGLHVCGIVSVAKDHGTTRQAADGGVSMPVAVYLDDGVKGSASVMPGRPGEED